MADTYLKKTECKNCNHSKSYELKRDEGLSDDKICDKCKCHLNGTSSIKKDTTYKVLSKDMKTQLYLKCDNCDQNIGDFNKGVSRQDMKKMKCTNCDVGYNSEESWKTYYSDTSYYNGLI